MQQPTPLISKSAASTVSQLRGGGEPSAHNLTPHGNMANISGSSGSQSAPSTPPRTPVPTVSQPPMKYSGYPTTLPPRLNGPLLNGPPRGPSLNISTAKQLPPPLLVNGQMEDNLRPPPHLPLSSASVTAKVTEVNSSLSESERSLLVNGQSHVSNISGPGSSVNSLNEAGLSPSLTKADVSVGQDQSKQTPFFPTNHAGTNAGKLVNTNSVSGKSVTSLSQNITALPDENKRTVASVSEGTILPESVVSVHQVTAPATSPHNSSISQTSSEQSSINGIFRQSPTQQLSILPEAKLSYADHHKTSASPAVAVSKQQGSTTSIVSSFTPSSITRPYQSVTGAPAQLTAAGQSSAHSSVSQPVHAASSPSMARSAGLPVSGEPSLFPSSNYFSTIRPSFGPEVSSVATSSTSRSQNGPPTSNIASLHGSSPAGFVNLRSPAVTASPAPAMPNHITMASSVLPKGTSANAPYPSAVTSPSPVGLVTNSMNASPFFRPQVSSMGPSPTFRPPVSSMGSSPTFRPPVSSMGSSPTFRPPVSSMGPSPTFRPPVSSIGPSPTFIPPASSTGPSPAFRPPVSSLGPPAVRPPVSATGPVPTFRPPVSAVGPSPTYRPPISSIGPTPSFRPPVSSVGTSPTFRPPSTFAGPMVTPFRPPTMSAGFQGASFGASAVPIRQPSFPGPSSFRPPPPTVAPSSASVAAQPSLVPPPRDGALPPASSSQQPVSRYPQFPAGAVDSRSPQFQPPGSDANMMGQLSQQLGGLSVIRDGWSKSWGTQPVDLFHQRVVVPPQGVVPPKPLLSQEYLPNCSPDIFRCTLTKVPETKQVLQKSRLPFGILIHPFKDLEHLPVVSCSTIVRCRACRTYINPYVIFKGERRWECNLCFRVNDLPDEFQYDPVSKTYGDPSRRPEVREATIEFIAPQEYMLRPPQPATYLWVLDVSRKAVETGYLKIVCDTLLSLLDDIPGDRRTMIGFITFSTSVQFYLMGEGQKNVQMLDVGEAEDIFVPCPEDLLVNLEENRPLLEKLLTTLPEAHENTIHTQSAMGAALTAAYKLMGPIGGRVTMMAVTLPNLGPGALKSREDPNQRAGKDINNLGPATDFYKKLALDCSGQQVAVDLFTLNSHYIDLATLTGISKFSGGCIHHFPGFSVQRNPSSVAPFVACLNRYITRKIGFEAVMRVRATRGISITNFHGNFFVRSTDLLSLPNINPDAGFGMQVSLEEPLHNIRNACFQAALLYTSSRGERRIRVHTLCLPVSPNVHEVIQAADQQAVVGLLAKMAVDRCISSQMTDAREALINACVDVISAYRASISNISHGGLESPPSLQMLPLYVIALLKSVPFRSGLSTKLDDRLFAMCEFKSQPLRQLILSVYPDLYAIHQLNDKGAISVDDKVIPQPDRLHLSAERLERLGAYLMDAGSSIYIYIRSGISPEWVDATLGVPSYAAIPQPLFEDPFPKLDTLQSEHIRNFIAHLQRKKPYAAQVFVLREDNPARTLFIQHLVDDRTEGSHSYIEFLQYIKGQIK